MVSKFLLSFIIVSFLYSCGSDDTTTEDTQETCKLRLNTGDPCSYEEFQDIVFTHGTYMDIGPSDDVELGNFTHFYRRIVLADGDISLNEEFLLGFDENTTAFIKFYLFSFGADKFNPGVFKQRAAINTSTSSYMSLAGDLTYDCGTDINGSFCNSFISQGSAIVIIEELDEKDELYFDVLLSFIGSGPKCIKGTFSGEFKNLLVQ